MASSHYLVPYMFKLLDIDLNMDHFQEDCSVIKIVRYFITMTTSDASLLIWIPQLGRQTGVCIVTII